MFDTERAWAAGFFDGEGNTGVTETADKYIRMQVAQAGSNDSSQPPEVLVRFGAAVSIGRLYGPYVRREGWQAKWTWNIAGYEQCVRALTQLWPYLSSIKKEQAQTALANCSTNGRKRTHCKYGHEFTPENTYVHNGWQHCRTCRAQRAAEARK